MIATINIILVALLVMNISSMLLFPSTCKERYIYSTLSAIGIILCHLSKYVFTPEFTTFIDGLAIVIWGFVVINNVRIYREV